MTHLSGGLHGRQVFVTGATGFLGSAFVRHAASEGAIVTVLARDDANLWRLADHVDRLSIVRGALSALSDLDWIAKSDSVFVHFAAAGVQQTFDDVASMVETNVAGTASALQFAHRCGIARFVLVGTSGEYGPGTQLAEESHLRPTSIYGSTRAAATLLARAFSALRDLDVVVVRPFAVFGPFEAAYRLVPHVILSAMRGVPVRISSGHQTRDYVHIDDVSTGISRACTVEQARNGTFNLCTGIETTVRDAAALAVHLVGSGVAIETGAVRAIPGEMWRTSGDPSRAREVLGWQPDLTLQSGLERTIEWFARNAQRHREYAMPG